MSRIIYVVYAHSSNYDEEDDVTHIKAFSDLTKAEAVANAFNEKPTMRQIIFNMVEKYTASLPAFRPTQTYSDRPPLVFDQERRKDVAYQHEYKAMLKARKQERKAHERAIEEEHRAFHLAQRDQIAEYRRTLNHQWQTIKDANDVRDERTYYNIATVELDD